MKPEDELKKLLAFMADKLGSRKKAEEFMARNFKEAAQMALDDRWYPMAKAKTLLEARDIYHKTKCKLCELQRRHSHFAPFEKIICGKCPMDTYKPHTHKGYCSNGWQKWNGSYETNFHEAIMGVIGELEAIAKGGK